MKALESGSIILAAQEPDGYLQTAYTSDTSAGNRDGIPKPGVIMKVCRGIFSESPLITLPDCGRTETL
jgi:hypothetical protein